MPILRSIRLPSLFSFFWVTISTAGPTLRETIDRLIERRETNECVFLKGNHEQIAINSLKDPGLFQKWMRLGGMETLVSYGITPSNWTNEKRIAELQAAFHRALPHAHFRFFRDQPTSFVCGDFFFAHAGEAAHRIAASSRKRSSLDKG